MTAPILTVLRGRLWRRWKRLLLWFLAVIASVAAAAFVAYYGSPRLLTIDSGTSSAQAMVVLGGDPSCRPARAAELFAAGAAPLIIVSGNGDWDVMEEMLKLHGVPPRAIVVEDKAKSTKENAEFSVAILRKAGITNAIIVTSWYHSRRALNCFRHAAPEMRFYSRPCYYGLARADWPRNGVGGDIRAEYVKLLGYWVRYGVAPF